MLTIKGRIAKAEPPYEVGEMIFLPNSWPNVYEILSPGYGKAVGVWGFAGDQVLLQPFTVYRPLVGYQAGKVFYVSDEQGYYKSIADRTPPANMTTYLPPGLSEEVPADPRALEFMQRKVAEILAND